jgi:hypothetical protein
LIYRSLRLRRFASTYLPDWPAVRHQTKVYTRVSQDPRLCKSLGSPGDMSRNSIAKSAGSDSARALHTVRAEIFHMNITHMGQAELSQSWYLGCTSSWCSGRWCSPQRSDRPSTQRANTPSSGFHRMVILSLSAAALQRTDSTSASRISEAIPSIYRA